MNARTICILVFRRVQQINLIFAPRRCSTLVQENTLAIMGINRSQIRSKPDIWCKWERPPPGWFKLNSDGLAIHGIITGGGVMLDQEGNLIGEFSNFYGEWTNTLAKFMALRDGLVFCLALNISPMIVKSDSTVVVKAMRSGAIGNWQLASGIFFSGVYEIILS